MAIKSDDLWETIDRIDAVLPNRRTIFLTRDFRDNLLSVAGSDFGPIDPLHAARYVKHQVSVYEREYARTASQSTVSSAVRRSARRSRDGRAPDERPFRSSHRSEIGGATTDVEHPAGEHRAVETPVRETACPRGDSAVPRAANLRISVGVCDGESPRPADWMMATAAEVVQRIGQKGRHITKRLGR
jgi:hypothetical protein